MARGFLWLFFTLPGSAHAQKFNFQHFNVQNGLVQSQVNGICQDRFDNLWIATLGGISRFDGKTFTNYTEAEGLINNFANCIMADRSGNIWIGTRAGLSRFDGRHFDNFRFTNYPAGNFVDMIEEDGQGRIWVKARFKLYLYHPGGHFSQVEITGRDETLSTMAVDKQGVLWAALHKQGLFRLEGNQWVKAVGLNPQHEMDFYRRIIFDRTQPKRMLLLCKNKLVSAEAHVLTEKESLLPADKNNFYQDLFQDASGRCWLLSLQGLFLLSGAQLTPFDEGNGYTGNGAATMFQDREKNIWFGTNGSGILQYSRQPFLTYDQFSASQNASVMSLVKRNDGGLFIGTDGAGLFIYDGHKMSSLPLPSDDPREKHIASLSTDNKNNLYILTTSGKIWRYDQRRFEEVKTEMTLNCINGLLPDSAGGFWIAGCSGLFHQDASGKMRFLVRGNFNKFLYFNDDSVLVSAADGLFILKDGWRLERVGDSLVNGASIMALAVLGKYDLLATADKGLILYNTSTRQSRQVTKENGLNSDFVYSVITDGRSRVWLGTGRGINKLILDSSSGQLQVSSSARMGDISSAESNQDAAVYDRGGNLWFGTGSGLMKYLPEMPDQDKYMPPVVLRAVQLFSKNIPSGKYATRLSSWYGIPEDLSLPGGENHLSFAFGVSSFLNANRVLYQYRLLGMEKEFSALTSNHEVVFPGLPPGNYVFQARAFLPGLGYSKNTLAFPFVIRAAFYQTLIFRLGLLLLLIALLWWIQWLRIKQQTRRRLQIEEIKKAENLRARQIASEDFHDEIGNTLTRIQVLTDVLQTRIGNEREEENRIIRQIKENLSHMYQGTRDILWTFNAESDRVDEIADRLGNMGMEIFQDTPVKFTFDNRMGADGGAVFPGGYSRNLLMILKEAMYNSLKYARASHVQLVADKTDSRIFFVLNDDGVGYDTAQANKGHGTANMIKRAKRIHAEFEISSRPLIGTTCILIIPFS